MKIESYPIKLEISFLILEREEKKQTNYKHL